MASKEKFKFKPMRDKCIDLTISKHLLCVLCEKKWYKSGTNGVLSQTTTKYRKSTPVVLEKYPFVPAKYLFAAL